MKRRVCGITWMSYLAVAIVFGPIGRAGAQSVWELTPYRVRIAVAAGESPQLTPRLMADLAADNLIAGLSGERMPAEVRP